MLGRDEITRFDLVRCDRLTGSRVILKNLSPIKGRFPAERELKKLVESNRDPNVIYMLEASSRTGGFVASSLADFRPR